MKRLMIMALCAGLATPVIVTPADANTITRACMTSKRKAANLRLCNCIQAAADRTLSSSDQRLASTFFRDPHRAQEIRQSDRASHERFWLRYKEFGTRAQRMCG